MVALNLTLLVLSCIVLVISGTFLVKSLRVVAAFLRVSEFVAAFIIMAVATSIPELFVSITAALSKNSALALGTVIGSNIADLTIVIGIGIVLGRHIKIKREQTKTDALYMVAISAIPLALMFIGKELSRLDGVILLLLFVFYSWRLLKEKKLFSKVIEERVGRRKIIFNMLLFVVAIMLLFYSADWIVEYATRLSIELNLAPILIGLLLIALCATLPEMVFGTNAILRGHGEMSLGNIIGSVIANSTLILGVAALINPIKADFTAFVISAIFMLIVSFLFATFVESGSSLDWKEGISLILLYVFFILVETSGKLFFG